MQSVLLLAVNKVINQLSGLLVVVFMFRLQYMGAVAIEEEGAETAVES